jgi:hypothetical protein
MVAGRLIAVHDRNSVAPPSTAGQDGMSTTIRKPAIEARLNISRARLVPRRSERYPPGNE